MCLDQRPTYNASRSQGYVLCASFRGLGAYLGELGTSGGGPERFRRRATRRRWTVTRFLQGGVPPSEGCVLCASLGGLYAFPAWRAMCYVCAMRTPWWATCYMHSLVD